jgi:glycerophosphoryl diester phosphodiesterase
MSKLMIAISFVVFVLIGAVEGLFQFKEMRPFSFGPRQWIHHLGNPQNSMEGLEKILAQGLMGVECDVHYDESEGRFVVTHDWPPPANRLYLDDVFNRLSGSAVKIWIDLKNAKAQNYAAVASKISEMAKKSQLEDRYFVESPELLHQILLSRTGVPSVLWLDPAEKSRLYHLRNWANKLAIVLSDAVAISMPSEKYTENVQGTYQSIPKLIFTVNDTLLLQKLSQDQQVKIVLSDLP